MRKHFLLLFLLTLLPLAGWAITEVNVRAKVFEIEYGKANPENVDKAMLRLSIDDNVNGDLAAAIAAKLNYTTDRVASDAVSNETRTFTISLKLAGDDVVTVDLDGDNTVEEYAINITSATAAMKTKKATTGTGFAITGTPVFVTGDLSYTGNPQSLVTAESIAADAFYGTVNTLSKLPMEFSVDGGTTWADNAEVTNANTAGYSLNYRIKGYGVNFEADGARADLDEAKAVAKATITLTAGTAAEDLTYDGQTHQLLTAPVTASAYNPTLVYSVDKHNGTNYPQSYDAIASVDAIAGILLTNAGKYKVKCDISAADKENLEVTGGAWVSGEIEIAKANAIVTAPAALKPSYTNAPQNLISAGVAISGATIKYCATNSDDEDDWKTVIPQGTTAGNYTAWYKVADDGVNGNWDAVAPTQITGVTIEKAIVTVKVNNISKVYDGTTSLANATIDESKPKFTFITLQTGDDADDYAAVPYSAVEAVNASDNAYVGVVTIATDALTAINNNYAYYVQPGNLTIGKSQLTITATNTNAAYGVANAAIIANAYTIKDQNNADVDAADAFEADHFPVLTSAQAATAEYKPGTYDVTFNEGTIKAGGNYEVAENGYVIGDAKFVIGKASQVIITVIPKEVQYGTAEDWTATPVQDVDYYVANLLPGDEITSISLTRAGYSEQQFDVNTYALTATAEIAHPEWYASEGAIIFNNSTFNITPRKLTATIAQQTIVKDVETTFDNTKWDVTPMQFNQNKSVLGATLELADGASSTTGTKNDGIILSITNPNYVLDGANVTAGKAYGTLIVISASDFALSPNDEELPSKLAAVNPETDYQVVFSEKTTTIGEWYAMVLPFDVDPLKMVQAFNRYVIFNELNKAGTTDGNFKFTLTMDKIPAGTPFLIKFASKTGDTEETVVNWATEFNKATYGTVNIKKDITDVETEYVDFTGTYTAKDLKGLKDGAGEKVWWLAQKAYKGDNNWKKPKTNMHTALPMEAYLTAEGKTWTSYAPNITVEDFDGSVTAIKSLSADEIHGLNVKGMYNLNGMKMNNVPTQKGVYIVNGKKVVIK